ncbi:MAG TPA: intracellular septation protein A, partial [Alphaproteobacteria bacterium]|nr:intracellular septation protein A [Alphaproteobacteria bacterium]
MGPLIVFFIANYFTGEFMLAVGVLVAATVVALAAGWILERRISMMALFGCVAVSFFGGLSLYFDNELFIKIKPTVLTVLLAAVIAGGRLLGRNPLGAIMGAQLRMHDAGWR